MILEKMKDIRDNEELTQLEVSKRLNVSRSTYAGWENGIDFIPLFRLVNLCNLFKVSLDYICKLSTRNNYNEIVFNKELLGRNLKRIRLEHNDTQKYISYIIKTSQTNYSNYENGKTVILTELLIDFCKHYKVSMDSLFRE